MWRRAYKLISLVARVSGSSIAISPGDRIVVNSLIKGKKNRITGLDRPRGFQEVEAPRFQDSRHLKVVRFSSLRTGRLYSQEVFLVFIAVRD